MANEESVSNILLEKSLPLFNGKRLTVKERTHNKASPQNATTRSKMVKPSKDSWHHSLGQQWQSAQIAAFVPEKLAKKLKSSVKKVDEKINLMMEELCLTEEDVKLRRLVCKLLVEVFHEVNSSASVVLFGSTVTGVGWKGSDLDICLLTEDTTDTFHLDYSVVIDVLRSFAPGCVNIIPVLTAKCPLIKFRHQPSDLSCDLSINNRLGVANSDLLRCYMLLDPRVPRLVFVVRAWAKAKGLAVCKQLSNYALTIMVLYFLQTQIPPVIPSLQLGFGSWIKNQSDQCNGSDNGTRTQLESQIIGNWDCSFFRDFSRLSPSANSKSLSLLLEEFFLFFSTDFDSSKFVVSIRTGRETTISEVLDELKELSNGVSMKNKFSSQSCESQLETSSLSGENNNCEKHVPEAVATCSSSQPDNRAIHGKQVQFKVSALIVQDPFELTHNLTQNISCPGHKCIMELMKNAHKICKNLNSGSDNSKHSITLLDLLTVHKTAKKRRNTNCHSFFVAHQGSQDTSCTVKLTSTMEIFEFIVSNLEGEFGIRCERRNLAKRQCVKEDNLEVSSQPPQIPSMPQDKELAVQIQDCIAFTEKNEDDGQVCKRNRGDIDKAVKDFSAVCTASENTWTHSRRERRKSLQCCGQISANPSDNDMFNDKSQGQQIEISKSCDTDKFEQPSSLNQPSPELSDSSKNAHSITSPILVFELKVNSSSQGDSIPGCTVSVEHVESQEFQLFGNFFTAYKDYFTGLIAKKTK